MTNYISLHNRTHFSILNSLISPKDLFLRVKELGQQAVAITDFSSLAASWHGLKISKETGVKLIIGCDFYFTDDTNNIDKKLKFIVLIAKNAIGYKNLLTLNKKGFDKPAIIAKKPCPVIDWKLLEEHSEGLICLTGCANGVVAQSLNTKQFDKAEESLKRLISIFKDDLAIEVQANNIVRYATHYAEAINQPFTNAHLIRFAKQYNVRVVPTTFSHYLKKEDAKTHDVFIAIGAMQPVYSNARLKYDSSDLCLKSGDEVKAFFARNFTEQFAQELCDNTIWFANKCEEPVWIDPKYSNPSGKELPVFPVKDEPNYNEFKTWLSSQDEVIKKLDEDKNYLRYKCELAFKLKVPEGKDKIYRERLEEELDTLYYCGVSSYMLIVADLIHYAKSSNIPTGPGRGSAAGSLVAYLLDIHIADPIKYGLVFARFFNKLRASYADIDSDFSKKKRDLVLQYLINKYGKDHFAQITNINYITPKVYAKDLTRSCELAGDRQKSVELANNISDIIPKKDGEKEIRTYKELIDKVPLFSEYTKQYPELANHSGICGKPRALGIHASGMIISARPIHLIVPVRLDKDGVISTQFDKDRAEEVGLVKIDNLGIETLDVIEKTNELIKASGKSAPIIDFDTYDQKTYDLITKGDTFCVFQFGISAGTIDLCRKIKPKTIEDLAIITTLARPASREIREAFIETRAGKRKVKLLHLSLGNALGNTFGFPLYDESLLILAKDVAGWELDEADKLRKLTKEKGKNPEKAEKWRSEFIEGAIKNKVDQKSAIKIWDDVVVPYGRYSFNKSHAVLYSMISYHTAYLKAHFPVEFLLANLMSEVNSGAKIAKENIAKIKQELRNHGVKILPPDINKSDMVYTIQPDGSLLAGLNSLRGVGDEAIAEVLQKRPFTSLNDFFARTNTKVRATATQAFAAGGCFDSFGVPRKLIFYYCADYRKKMQVWLKKHDPNKENFEYPWPIEQEWSVPEIFATEKHYIGEAFSCKEKDAYGKFFKNDGMSVKQVKEMCDRDQIPSMRVLVKSVFELRVKKQTSKYLGHEMLKASIQDASGEQIGLTIFPKEWKKVKEYMKSTTKGKYKFDEGLAINFYGSVNVYEDEIGVVLNDIFDIALPPELPKDTKAKKVSMKDKVLDKKIDQTVISDDIVGYMSDIESSLVNDGFIDLDDENFEAWEK